MGLRCYSFALLLSLFAVACGSGTSEDKSAGPSPSDAGVDQESASHDSATGDGATLDSSDFDIAAPDAPDADPSANDGSVHVDATTDTCVPVVCEAGMCGSLSDGCGGKLACGACAAPGETCGGGGQPNVCGAAHETLHVEQGCFFEVVDADSEWTTTVGGATVYEWISIEYDAVHGGWRTNLFDRPVLNHGLFGFSRDVVAVEGRYVLGNAAQIHPDHATLDRRSVFYGRIDLEKKPTGQGYTGYTSWRSTYPWQVGETYHFKIVLDVVAKTQTLQIYEGGQLGVTQVGNIAYFDPLLTAVPWIAKFGGEESTGREVKPIGWTFCNLVIQADPRN